MSRPEAIDGQQWPATDLEGVPRCPVCASPNRRVLHQGLVDDTFFCAPGTWTLKSCERCDSAYLDPRPTANSISRAYASYYTHDLPAEPLRESVLKTAARRALRFMSSSYGAWLVGDSSSRTFGASVAIAVIRLAQPFREVIDARFRHLHRAEPGRDRLLDIGCGSGDFLLRAKALGWQAEGVDFDPMAVAAARERGLNVRIGSIEAYAEAPDQFDVITCNHVIEHVYDPHALLAGLFQVLKPGGRLWIETPNIGSIGHETFGPAWRGIETPRHLVLFRHESLLAALATAGFEVIEQTPWNFQHIRGMFAASRAIRQRLDPSRATTSLLPNVRLLRALVVEAFHVERREFTRLLAVKPVAPSESNAVTGVPAQ